MNFPLLSARGTSRATLVLLAIGGIGWWLVRRRNATRRRCAAAEIRNGDEKISVSIGTESKRPSGSESAASARRSTGSPEAEGDGQPAVALFRANALDLSLLRYLSDGTPSGLAEQIDRFVETLVKSEARVRAAAGSGNSSALGDAAHALLSQGRMVDAARLIAAAQQLEAATFETRPDEIARFQAVLLRETNELKALLARCRPPTPPK